MYELSKDRYLELKHYSNQLPEWTDKLEKMAPKFVGRDPTAEEAATIADLTNRIFQIEKIAREAFQENFSVGFYAVTHGLVLKTESYRLYFWLLDKER